ncbi:MAG: hypothetical protein HY393_04290 [Candidatus Diapherotrites archaeon]|nr:hypothetical protein [Candidatus Diapherotrites archaeon]
MVLRAVQHQRIAGIGVLLLLALLPLASATLSTTTMTWVAGTNKSFTTTYGAACSGTSFFFVETDANVNFGDADSDGNWAMVRPNSSSGGGTTTFCQSTALRPIVLTNNGNSTLNIDGNFLVDLNSTDVNIQLKVWMATATGCGVGPDGNGFGGWEKPCSVVSTTGAVTISTCKDFNSSVDTVASRLISSLPIGDSNGLCFSGETLQGPQTPGGAGGNISSGNHPLQFQIGNS